MLSLRKYDKQKWITFFTHLIVISMLFFLPEFMMNYSSVHRHPVMERMMYEKAAIFVAVFYLNYYVIINHTLFGKKQNYVMFFVWNLLIIIAFVLGFYYLRAWLWAPHPPRGPQLPDIPRMAMILRAWSYILRDVAMLVLTIALSAALRYAENWATLEKRHQQLLASQKAEELQNLKSQLNPHFLFNTLNTIYSLIDIDTKEAQNAIHQLSKLLRHVLYDNGQTQTLEQEIDFAKTYISLMEMRLGEGAVKADFSQVSDDKIQLAPLLFVTLIENAFKHGNTGQKGQPIEISISSDAEGTVTCRTFNHFVVGKSVDSKGDRNGGIGLSNLRRRLLLLYGDRASLSTHIDGDTYTAVLTIKRPDHE